MNTSRSATAGKPVFRTGNSKQDLGLQVIVGPFIHSLSWKDPCVIEKDGVIGFQNGKIIFVDSKVNLESLKAKYSFDDRQVCILKNGEFLMPGLIDTHIHSSQYPNSGLALDLPLLEWLDKYTFPLESNYADPKFAEEVYRKVVERTLSNGTTTASYFTTIHTNSALILADLVEQYGQRALIGKVCMDCFTPDYYIESTEESLSSTKEFVKKILARKNPLVLPTITPRFALTCTENLLKGLGDIAKKDNVHIQTHLCESLPEVDRAMELFPKYKNYSEIYAATGLLTEKAIMAHCVHLTDVEIEILRKHNTAISHCPTSNICLLSGLCPVRKIRDAGVKVGLGTDVSGGYSASILEAMRHAIITAKCRAINGQEKEPLNYREAIYLATLGGAEALALDKEIGNFQVGKSFDAIIVNVQSESSAVDVFPKHDLIDLIQKFIMLGDDRNIVKVFVDGQVVKSL